MVQTLINYTCTAQKAADLAYVRHLILTIRFKHCSVGLINMVCPDFFKQEPEREYCVVPDLSEKLQSRLRGRQIQSSPTLRCEYAIGIEIHRHAMNVY